jgi:hypothetical protein
MLIVYPDPSSDDYYRRKDVSCAFPHWLLELGNPTSRAHCTSSRLQMPVRQVAWLTNAVKNTVIAPNGHFLITGA